MVVSDDPCSSSTSRAARISRMAASPRLMMATRLNIASSLPPLLSDRSNVFPSMLMLVRGSESCADIEHLRTQGDLFGWKPYDSTLHRTSHEISPATRDQVAEAFAQVRPELWRRSSATDGKARVLLDIDASLVEIHSENR